MARHPHRIRTALTLVEGLVVIAVIGVVIALLLPSVRGAREPARRNSCLNNLKQIQIGLLNYQSAHGEFPPAYTTDADGKPLHSWRTLILPYIEHAALYKTIDLTKPWDDPANAKALASMPPSYRCPSRPDAENNRTTYLAVVTPESFFLPTKPRKRRDTKEIPSRKLTVIDVDCDHAVPWMAPLDADEALVLSLGGGSPRPRTHHISGMCIAYSDGSTDFLPKDTDAEARRQLISTAGNEKLDDTSLTN
jgi:type II secretory pathway pseudopilin PulG